MKRLSSWVVTVLSAARSAEAIFDRVRFKLKQLSGLLSPVEVLPYRGYGTPCILSLKGRVLEDKGITRSRVGDTAVNNLRNMFRRFDSSEIPGARVRARLGGIEVTTRTDAEGFFEVRFELSEPLPGKTAWHQVELELLSPRVRGQGKVEAAGLVLVPRDATFGVISDLDDTVVRSSATSFLKMVRMVLLENAHTRLPFEGVAEFYRALQRGPAEDGDTSWNPIFYVSSSPWNLYDVLEDFLDFRGVPAGPMFLKDWSPTSVWSHRRHKLESIRGLLDTYPELPFVLIGDSGQSDPEIYRDIVREYPGRIEAIYIRDITPGERAAAVRNIARELRLSGVAMLLAPDSTAAMVHAADYGLISADKAPKVAGERDEKPG